MKKIYLMVVIKALNFYDLYISYIERMQRLSDIDDCMLIVYLWYVLFFDLDDQIMSQEGYDGESELL